MYQTQKLIHLSYREQDTSFKKPLSGTDCKRNIHPFYFNSARLEKCYSQVQKWIPVIFVQEKKKEKKGKGKNRATGGDSSLN